MKASETFKRDFIFFCRELEKRLDPRDVGTPLHIFLADRMAQCKMGAWLDERRLLTPEEEQQYQDAIEARDAALKELGFDRNPLDTPFRAN
jgi:hypothetical protein